MRPTFFFCGKAKLNTSLATKLMHLPALESLAVVRDQKSRLRLVAQPFFTKASNDLCSGFRFHLAEVILLDNMNCSQFGREIYEKQKLQFDALTRYKPFTGIKSHRLPWPEGFICGRWWHISRT